MISHSGGTLPSPPLFSKEAARLFIGTLRDSLALDPTLFGVFSNLGAPKDLGNGIVMSAPNAGLPVMIMSIWGAVSAVSILAFSGLCAAIVSCEYKYTKSV